MSFEGREMSSRKCHKSISKGSLRDVTDSSFRRDTLVTSGGYILPRRRNHAAPNDGSQASTCRSGHGTHGPACCRGGTAQMDLQSSSSSRPKDARVVPPQIRHSPRLSEMPPRRQLRFTSSNGMSITGTTSGGRIHLGIDSPRNASTPMRGLCPLRSIRHRPSSTELLFQKMPRM